MVNWNAFSTSNSLTIKNVAKLHTVKYAQYSLIQHVDWGCGTADWHQDISGCLVSWERAKLNGSFWMWMLLYRCKLDRSSISPLYGIHSYNSQYFTTEASATVAISPFPAFLTYCEQRYFNEPLLLSFVTLLLVLSGMWLSEMTTSDSKTSGLGFGWETQSSDETIGSSTIMPRLLSLPTF